MHATEHYSATNEVAVSIGYHTIPWDSILEAENRRRSSKSRVTGNSRDDRFSGLAGSLFLVTICEKFPSSTTTNQDSGIF